MGHGQEEPVCRVTAVLSSHGFFQGVDRGFPVPRAVLGGAQSVPEVPYVWRQLDGFLGDLDRPVRIAEFWVTARSQKPREALHARNRIGVIWAKLCRALRQCPFAELEGFGVPAQDRVARLQVIHARKGIRVVEAQRRQIN
jgi:hypothetical protein